MMKGNLAQDSLYFRQKTHEFLWINMWITGDNYAFLVDKSRKYPHSINNPPIWCSKQLRHIHIFTQLNDQYHLISDTIFVTLGAHEIFSNDMGRCPCP